MKEFYSVAELLALNLNSLPKTRKGLDKFLARNDWKYKEVPSRGIGGMRKEYAPTAEIQKQILGAVLISEVKLNVSHELSTPDSSQFSVSKSEYEAAEMMNWQRDYAENRLVIVRYLQQQVKAGLKKTPAIQRFVDEAQLGTLPEAIQQALLKANAKAGEGRVISRRTVIDWIQAVELAEAKGTPVIVALAPKARRTEIPKWAPALLKLWGQPQKPALAAVIELLPGYLENTGIPCPTYAQAYRFINEKMGNVEAQRGRMGSRDIKNIKPFIRRDSSMLLPTDVYTADGHCFDAEIAHPIHQKAFKPEITAIIDVGTRRFVGWSVDLAESGFAVLDAVRMACCHSGIPAIFYVDNGAGYKNKLFGAEGRGVMARLGTQMSHSLPYNSQAKGVIERSHQTLWVKTAKRLSTYIGKDMDAEASGKIHKLNRKDLKKLGESKTLMRWNDFLFLVNDVVNQYNNAPHSSLKRIVDPITNKKRYQTPNEAWNEAVMAGSTIDLVEDWDREDLFRPYEERKVRRGEIELFGNRYFSKELEEYHGDIVHVGYDIQDAEKITVRDENGSYICHATWNANSRAYFPQTVVEQARQKRADGRLRRLAVKQDEVLQEVRPQRVIEHIESESIIQFSEKTRRLVEDLARQPLEVETQPRPRLVCEQTSELINQKRNAEESKQLWMDINERVVRHEEVSDKEAKFYKTFVNTKIFKNFEIEDAELSTHLAQYPRQA